MNWGFLIMSSISLLAQLGWRSCFQQQLDSNDDHNVLPARVTAVQRTVIDTLTVNGQLRVTLSGALLRAEGTVAVGDWVLIETTTARVLRTLERQTVIARMAAGTEHRRQLIAANLDTLFVVTSCNADFNLARLERYFALAYEARVEPVVIVTKSDLCANADEYLDRLRDAAPRVTALSMNATKRGDLMRLSPWLAAGQTVAFVGSSGVGKSTLINTLLDDDQQLTGGIREDDAKGRHTTTSRQMFMLPAGAWIIDTPGMREINIGASEEGVREVFADIETLAAGCRFRDCAHERESGCAVRQALATGELDERRLRNYRKLQREAANAARSLHERRALNRQSGQLYKNIKKQRRKDRGGE